MAMLPAHIMNAIRGLLFNSGLDEIERAYLHAVPDTVNFTEQAEIAVRQEHGIRSDEPIPPVETDEDGEQSKDYYDEIDELARGFASTQNILVGSFAIALFHFVERQSNKWLAVRQYKHNDVMSWLKHQGCTPDESALAELQLVANTLKHGAGPSARALFMLNPGLFDPTVRATSWFAPSDENLIVTKAMLDGYFAAARTTV